ncbi:MAG: divalent-cation tolerance protein CutA [Rhodospirillaceae bacterium]|nr:divalent-cation tolerance protein CutA [Rhodospirillaceae bacterium]MDE0617445.1 divalent-cation tolerance protein CutA [Rhodospirillaceae bacterium]
MSATLVYMTAGSVEEARAIGASLVARRLAACVNILPGMLSQYRWEGSIQTDEEVVLIAKTRSDLVDSLTGHVREIHSYDCPCVVALPIEGGNPAFLQWIEEETAEASGAKE